jgi:predicted Zn finger-like uncharacterized protein
MRITCPNCGAQYEVDDALIPEAGRDVQCSNCGKGWFQARHPEPVEAAEDEPVAEEIVEEIAVEDTVTAETVAEAPETVEEAVAEVTEAVEEVEAKAAEPVSPPPAPPAEAAKPAPAMIDEDDDEAPAALPVRKPDESVLAVLREEAQREIAQRRQETGGIETQPDLGLAEPVERRTTPAAEVAATAAVAGAARRDLLPDIDVINSTLRSDADRGAAHAGDDDEMVVERRRGFRMGFGLVLLLVAALILLYVAAGWLAQTVPALGPLLAAYVEAANGFRAWIDGLLAAGTAGLSQ